MKKIILALILSSSSLAVCIHEYRISGNQLSSILDDRPFARKFISIDEGDGFFKKIDQAFNINPNQKYTIHIPVKAKEELRDYDQSFIKYYRYSQLLEFLEESGPSFKAHNYKVEVIGKSIQGRSLYSIYPNKLNPNKKTILMFGRHHGDEGTANWIIEGFVKHILENKNFFEKFQLVLYPMVNPDGAESRRRYNKNSRDLNRSWGTSPELSYDEAQVHHKHINELLLKSANHPVIMLDMHGSYTEDFIYRVDQNFKGPHFYREQQNFINELGSFDAWQSGNSKDSNGHRKMARIMFVREYGVNALTHETPRDIRKSPKRTITDLYAQGSSIAKSILSLY